ncbi:hypothetical protein JW906_11715 [bacterium]|nr:hypothetical protein [bacterium]
MSTPKDSLIFSFIPLVLAIPLFSQIPSRQPIQTIRLMQGFVLEGLSGTGIPQATVNSVSNIGSCNPALWVDETNVCFGISEQFESGIDPAFLVDMYYRRDRKGLPQSAGIVLPAGRLRFGAGFSQGYNAYTGLGDLEFTHIDSSGDYVSGGRLQAFSRTLVNGFSALLSTSCSPASATLLSIGIRMSLDRLSFYEKVHTVECRAEDWAAGWSAGMRLDFEIQPSMFIRIGTFFKKGPRFRTNARVSGMGSLLDSDIDPSVTGNNQAIAGSLIRSEYPVRTEMPSRLQIGCFAGSESSVFLTADYALVSLDRAIEGSEQGREIAGSFAFRPLHWGLCSIGFLSMLRDYGFSGWTGIGQDLSALYWTVGCVVEAGKIRAELAFASSKTQETHPWYRQHILKMIIGGKL